MTDLTSKKLTPPVMPSAPLILPDSLAPGTEHLHPTDAHLVRLFRAARPTKPKLEMEDVMYYPNGPMGIFMRPISGDGPPYEYWAPSLGFEETRLRLFRTSNISRSTTEQAEYDAEVAAFAHEEIRRAHAANADGRFEELLSQGTLFYRAGD